MVSHGVTLLLLPTQAAPSPEDVNTFFLTEGELVGEIISVVEAETSVPDWLRTLALRTIAIQVIVRSYELIGSFGMEERWKGVLAGCQFGCTPWPYEQTVRLTYLCLSLHCRWHSNGTTLPFSS